MGVTSLTRRARFQSLAGCLLVALAAGTNYVYSAYAPQLGQALNLNHTQLNLIGIAGNIGGYFFAPVLGWVVDQRGPRLPMFGASILLFLGYGGIAFLFSNAPQLASGRVMTPLVSVLALCCFATGIAGSAGILSAMNAGVKAVEDKYRASTAGGISSAFGLSAFFFSAIAKELFPGRTGAFLVVLCAGTAGAVLAGALLVRAEASEGITRTIDGESREQDEDRRKGQDVERSGVARPETTEQAPLLSDSASNAMPYGVEDPLMNRTSVTVSGGARMSRSLVPVVPREDVHGLGLCSSLDFWIICGIIGCLGGPGLMYINNVGSIVQALFAAGDMGWDKTSAAAVQATQVGIVSVCSFVGRLSIGFLADLLHTHTIPRASCLILSSTFGIVATLILFGVTKPGQLGAVSAMLGLSYGTTFALFPTLVLELFGMRHLAQNAGLMSIAVAVFGNVYNYGFGRNFDRHTKAAAANIGEGMVCLEGPGCYVQSVYVALVSCCVALVLSGVATQRSWARQGITSE